MDLVAGPDELADHMGVQVLSHRGGPKGLWLPERRAITLRANLGHVQRRCTLAHELGHAHHNDLSPAPDKWVWARQERRADEFAARNLITADAYQCAELIAGHDVGAIALELGVTKHLVKIWRALHLRKTAA